MHTDLMRASRLKLAFHISVFAIEFIQNMIMCDGFFAVFFIDRHLLAVNRMTTDLPLYGTIFCKGSEYDCMIPSRDRMFLKLFCNALMCIIVFAGNDHTGCVLIDTMHDSRTHNAIDP